MRLGFDSLMRRERTVAEPSGVSEAGRGAREMCESPGEEVRGIQLLPAPQAMKGDSKLPFERVEVWVLQARVVVESSVTVCVSVVVIGVVTVAVAVAVAVIITVVVRSLVVVVVVVCLGLAGVARAPEMDAARRCRRSVVFVETLMVIRYCWSVTAGTLKECIVLRR